MTIRKINLVLLLIPLSCLGLKGQMITRSTLGCMGASLYSSEGVSLKQTVGQPSNTKIFRINGTIIRQGFQQKTTSAKYQLESKEIEFSLYPNPANKYVTIDIKEYKDQYSILIKSMQGITIYQSQELLEPNHELNVSKFPVGIYIVSVITNQGSSSQKLIIH